MLHSADFAPPVHLRDLLSVYAKRAPHALRPRRDENKLPVRIGSSFCLEYRGKALTIRQTSRSRLRVEYKATARDWARGGVYDDGRLGDAPRTSGVVR